MKKKTLIARLLTLCMVASMLPTAAYADVVDPVGKATIIQEESTDLGTKDYAIKADTLIQSTVVQDDGAVFLSDEAGEEQTVAEIKTGLVLDVNDSGMPYLAKILDNEGMIAIYTVATVDGEVTAPEVNGVYTYSINEDDSVTMQLQYMVSENAAVWMGGQVYDTIPDALAADVEGPAYLYLLNDLTLNAGFSVNTEAVLYMNGHDITFTAGNYGITVMTNGKLDLYGNGTLTGGAYALAYVQGNGVLTLEGNVKIVNTARYGVMLAAGGTLNATSGSIYGTQIGVFHHTSGGGHTIVESGMTINGGERAIGSNNGDITILGGNIGNEEAGNKYGIYAKNSTVDVQGGYIVGTTYGIYSMVSPVTISGGTIEVTGDGSSPFVLYMLGAKATVSGGTMRTLGETVIDGDKRLSPMGILLGNVDANNTSGPASLEMTGGSVESAGFALSGNNNWSGGTVAEVTGGSLVSTGATGIYWPMDGQLTIGGTATVEGLTGIEAKMGTLTLNGGSVTGTGAFDERVPMNGGSAPEGSAILLSCQMYGGKATQYRNSPDLKLFVHDGEITSKQGNAITINNSRDVDVNADIMIDGGIVTGASDKQALMLKIEEGIASDHTVTSLMGGIYSTMPPKEQVGNQRLVVKHGEDFEIAENISLDKTELIMTVGEKVSAPVQLATNALDDAVVTWASDNENVATVSAEGLVTPISAGSANITATVDTWTATCEVKVYNALTIEQSILDMTVGYRVSDPVALVTNAAEGDEVGWASDNEAVATVSATGVVTPVAVGTANITGTAHGETVTCVVTVTNTTRPSSGGSSSGGSRPSQPIEELPDTVVPMEEKPFLFQDVKETDWAYEPVKDVFDKGLMEGIDDTHFAPHTLTNRAMVLAVLYRMDGEPEVDNEMEHGFVDVIRGGWYETPVLWGIKTGVTNGYNDTEFGPTDDVTRAQLITFLYRYAVMKEYDVADKGELAVFTDHEEIPIWAHDAMEWAVGIGIIQGRGNGTVDPNGIATRAETAKVAKDFLDRYAPKTEATGK